MQFVVLSSSRGTTFQSVLDFMEKGTLTAICRGLVSDSADRGCVQKAKNAGLPVTIVSRGPKEGREEYDRRLHSAIQELFADEPEEPKVLAALGWMFIFTPWFISQWKNRIINVHPALLPKYGGKGMYGSRVHKAVLKAEEKESGISIHLMDEGIDTGQILEQKTCSVLPDDTPDSLKERVQALEKKYYPTVLQQIHTGDIVLPSL